MRTALIACWIVAGTLFVGSEVTARLSRGRYATFGTLLDRLTRRTTAFILLFAGWMWLGWHMFAR